MCLESGEFSFPTNTSLPTNDKPVKEETLIASEVIPSSAILIHCNISSTVFQWIFIKQKCTGKHYDRVYENKKHDPYHTSEGREARQRAESI